MNSHKQYLQIRWEQRKQLVLDAIVELLKTPLLNKKGVLVSDTKSMLLYLNRDIRTGINTVREVFHVLENENVIYCVNPSKQRCRRYLLVKKED